MNDLLNKAFALGFGLTAMSKEKLETYVNELVNKGENASADAKEWVSKLVQKGEEERSQLSGMIREQMQQVLKEYPLATKEDIERLEMRIQQMQNPNS